MEHALIWIGLAFFVIISLGFLVKIVKMYVKVEQGQALVINGPRGPKVSFSAMLVLPIIHQKEIMDISVKRIKINRSGKEGLICKDNIRANIEVVFFVRVSKTVDDVLKVAQSIGCQRASDEKALFELFNAKFSEALKTVGKRFDFEELYTERDKFKGEILDVIGPDLNGYVIDDSAIDSLEQTPVELLDPENILDVHGIKKITDITSGQRVLTNRIDKDKEQTITKQDVVAREAILTLLRQQAEAEAKYTREVESAKARESSETDKVRQEERRKAELARIQTEEELLTAEQNKQRQVLVALKSKEKTEAVETERVDKERLLELNEKERIVELAKIAKEKAVEEERKNIQEVIRERVIVEKSVVEEEERIKETRLVCEAKREKEATLIKVDMQAEDAKIREVKAAESKKEAARLRSEQQLIEAEAELKSAEKKAQAMKILAEARASEEAAHGLSEAQVLEAKALALEKQGSAEANVMERKAIADAKAIEVKAAALEKQGAAEASVTEKKAVVEAKGIELKAAALEKQGAAEASVTEKKALAEAKGIDEKATAMKKLDGSGRQHEEFKLKLQVEKEIQLAKFTIQKDLAQAQAQIIQEGLKSANIEIIGGESLFFERIAESIVWGKSFDRRIQNSAVLTNLKDAVLSGDKDKTLANVKKYVHQFGLTAEDIKNLTLSALSFKLIDLASDDETKYALTQLYDWIKNSELASKPATILS